MGHNRYRDIEVNEYIISAKNEPKQGTHSKMFHTIFCSADMNEENRRRVREMAADFNASGEYRF